MNLSADLKHQSKAMSQSNKYSDKSLIPVSLALAEALKRVDCS